MSWQIVAGIIGLIGYVVLIIQLLVAQKQQSFASFMLWAMLDGIATITVILKHGNFWLPLSNAGGSVIIAAILLFKKKFSWLWIETSTTVLVIACIVCWFFAGAKAGIIASSIAMSIAGIPQVIDTFKHPKETPTLVYSIFLAANIISFAAGKAWTIEERFYSGCGIAVCAVIVLFSLRKRNGRLQ